ncbi:MAG: DUF4203 domain-containing protein [Propionicimonas sp.]|uniref:TM7S3/TM198-like domain-containing protein n=1 Tax=Propionicimonas sp. TaxID=1955623 RepID=UPI002B215726|nr:DUF4203 domain-containing protein [Propionicimonas sp.]MEA4944568.1 DUF4203 domain-containing protein [Propionicimonas sp.]MEA5052327.1 DUF4203 domain-containing protein [Propionicimonas sp.]MEA5117891.1 DUF4203 domain-containing protein [Propionicimonas sp.]
MSPEVLVPAVVIAAGLVLCFFGYVSMRWILTIIGGFAGWRLGGYVSTYLDLGPEFRTVIYWGAAILIGLLLATLAFAFYTTGVLISVGAIGYSIGVAVAPMFGFAGTQVLICGGFSALVLAIVALASRLPKVLLVVVTSVVGAAAVVVGLLGLLGAVDVTALTWDTLPSLLTVGLPWFLLFFAVLTAGILAQLKGKSKPRLAAAYA